MIDHACMSLDEERKEATPETVEVQGCTASQRSRDQAPRASARARVSHVPAAEFGEETHVAAM
jgi:hypothetical protein